MTEYNKTELVQALDARFLDIDTETIVTIVDGVFDEVKRAVIVEDRVEISDFGVFCIKKRSREQGTMPEGMLNSAGIAYDRPVDYTVDFKESESFYNELNSDDFIDPVVVED